jgi:hypothetical protein
MATLLALVLRGEPARAQTGATVGFRNELKSPVNIQGYSIVGGAPRMGQPIVLTPGRIGLDLHVPPGARFYNIYDANQPNRVILRDFPVRVLTRDLLFAIRPSPIPQRVLLVPIVP